MDQFSRRIRAAGCFWVFVFWRISLWHCFSRGRVRCNRRRSCCALLRTRAFENSRTYLVPRLKSAVVVVGAVSADGHFFSRAVVSPLVQANRPLGSRSTRSPWLSQSPSHLIQAAEQSGCRNSRQTHRHTKPNFAHELPARVAQSCRVQHCNIASYCRCGSRLRLSLTSSCSCGLRASSSRAKSN